MPMPMPSRIPGTELWEQRIWTAEAAAYINAHEPSWHRFEGPRPFRIGDMIRLPMSDMVDYMIAIAVHWRPSDVPSLLERRQQLKPFKSPHVVIPKALP
jgi:hypothetical protein